MIILDALVRLRDDLKLWVTNNLKTKLNKNLGAENQGKILSIDSQGNIILSDPIAGKSAYETALEGGYEGTEEEFAEQLAKIASLDIYEGETIEIWDGTGTETNPISNFNLSDGSVPLTSDGQVFYVKEE